MSGSVNGIAHIQLTVRDPGRCRPFWERLCHFLDMKTLIKGEEVVYCIGVPGQGHLGAGGRLGPGGRGPAGGYGDGGVATD